MISRILIFALVVAVTRSALVPTGPGPNQTFKEGEDCTVSWDLDTTGKWTNFDLDLMSGSNLGMQTVVNVFKGRDGTKGATTYTWKCPKVTPNSAIYFYQFSQSGADTSWTTRFTIASASGETTPPSNTNQPGGQAIPWGIGRLTGAGASSANQTTFPSTSGSNYTAPSLTQVSSNSTNGTGAVLTSSNSTATVTNPSVANIPPKQTTSSAIVASNANSAANQAPTTSNTASTNSGTNPSSTSDAPSLIKSQITWAAMMFAAAWIVV